MGGGERGGGLQLPGCLRGFPGRDGREARCLGRTHISALKYSGESQCVEGPQNSWEKFIADDQ